MKMKKLVILLCAVLLVSVLAIEGTMAYLTSTDVAINTFTLGEIELDLAEPDWNSTDDSETRYPGDTKDKTPTVEATKDDMYMRIKVTIVDGDGNAYTGEAAACNLIWSTIYYDAAGTHIIEDTSYAASDIATYAGVNTAKFTYDSVNSTNTVHYYTYTNGGTAPAVFSDNGAAENDKAELFTNVVFVTDLTSANFTAMGDYKLVITAEAIQTNNIAAADAVAALEAAF